MAPSPMAVSVDINDDTVFFYCERMRCRLKKTACVERQKPHVFFVGARRKNYLECLNCDQGKAIAKEIKQNAKIVPKMNDTDNEGVCMGKGDIVVKSGKKRVESKQCAMCGEEFERPDSDTGPMWARRKYCSDKCVVDAKRLRNAKSKEKSKSVVKAKPVKQPKEKPFPNAVALLISTCQIHNSKLPDDPIFCEYLRLAYELGRSA